MSFWAMGCLQYIDTTLTQLNSETYSDPPPKKSCLDVLLQKHFTSDAICDK